MGQRLLLAVLSLAAVVPACASNAHAGAPNARVSAPGLDAAIARLEALERAARNDAEGWHAAHHIVADGPDPALVDAFVRRLAKPTASIPHRHFAWDATPLGGANREDGQAHFGQFALLVVRHSRDRALVAEVARGLRSAPRLKQTLQAIERLPAEIAALEVPADVLAWRARPDVRAKKALWSELDISWAVEAIVRADPRRDATELIDSQLALYRLDRDFAAMNFVPEHGVHILMMLSRVLPLLDRDDAARYRPQADAIFAELLNLGRPDRWTPSHYALFGHLLEIGFDRDAHQPAIDEARLAIVLERLAAYIESPEPKDYGFITHTLRGLRNLSAARAPRAAPRRASGR